jgi:hypothetical protein
MYYVKEHVSIIKTAIISPLSPPPSESKKPWKETKRFPWPSSHFAVFLCTFIPMFTLLKGLSHEIYRPVFWPVRMHLGLNVIHFCF